MDRIKSYFVPQKPRNGPEGSSQPDNANLKEKVPASQSSSSNVPAPWASRPNSRPPSIGGVHMSDYNCELMVNNLHQQQMERIWFDGRDGNEGVILKKRKGEYTFCPEDLSDEPDGLRAAVEELNVKSAMTVSSRTIKTFGRYIDRPFLQLSEDQRLQVLPSLDFLPGCQKHTCAAFIADRSILVVWDDDPNHLLERAAEVQKALMDPVWDGPSSQSKDAKDPVVQVGEVDPADVEEGETRTDRKLYLLMPITSLIVLTVCIGAVGGGYGQIAFQTVVDNKYIRLFFIAVLIPQLWFAMFFFQAAVADVLHCIGPVKQMSENTKFYSGKPPKRLRRDAGALPHMTIQLPVYKEGLKAVIVPTVRSLKAAISTYEMQGGTANIFVNDDGMQLISAEDAQDRREFYEEHNIGWVARPGHNESSEKGEVFIRRGKFKKASNMNYAMWASARVEDKLANVVRSEGWDQDREAKAYAAALNEVLIEEDGRMQADGNIRIGDYILIIDSDTRVPTDCLLDCVSEMHQCPQVAILQFSSGVLNVTDSYFEQGITFFTEMIYTMIRYAVASGDTAPFVGHNAVLRWSALQEIAYDCEVDSREKYWSEETVSEDFDMSLRLQGAGYIVRLGAYFGDGFKEGVSLTVYDELARWEKYAYGCSELLFNPFKYWLTRGPFTKFFINFIRSDIAFPSKITIMAYIGTYYAIGFSWFFTIMNYFLLGYLNGYLDHYYLDSFKIFVAIIFVFTFLGNISLAMLRYRIGEKAFFASLWENIKWIPLFIIFLGGISMHVFQALAAHTFSVNATWGATSKEAEDTTFFAEIPKILKGFRTTLITCILLVALILVNAFLAPPLWRVDSFIAIFPLALVVFCHFCLPFTLNPGLMKLRF